jgi:hypothetical protein
MEYFVATLLYKTFAKNRREIFVFEEMSSLLYCPQKFVANILLFEENFGSFSKIIANKWQIYLGMLLCYSYFRNLEYIYQNKKKKQEKLTTLHHRMPHIRIFFHV